MIKEILVFLAHFFIPGDEFTLKKLAGLLLGIAGLAAVFLDKSTFRGSIHYGDFMILTATVIWASVTVYLKRILPYFRPYQIVFYQMIFSCLLFLLGGFFLDGQMVTAVTWKVLGSLVYQSVVTASFGFIMWSSLLQKYGAVALHTYLFLMPVAGVLFSALLLGELLTAGILIAMTLIALGIVVVKYTGKIPFFPLRRSGI